MKVLFIGDIFGRNGRTFLKENMENLKNKYSPDFIIANGENLAGGKGITPSLAKEIFSMGVDFMTSGNHAFAKSEMLDYFDDNPNKIIRPLNFTRACPGKGYAILRKKDKSLGVINVIGQVFLSPADNPFWAVEDVLDEMKKECKNILVDFHGEATSEKQAFAWHFDGRVSAVLGTHTHVQTADERILPFGTAYISDVGMTGPYDGIIGADKEVVIGRFLSDMPAYFTSEKGRAQLNGVYIEMCEDTGKSLSIERIYEIDKL